MLAHYPWRRARRLAACTILLSVAVPTHAEDADPEHWWNGITFTPGVGWRALNIDMTGPGGEANLQTDFASSAFGSLDIESPRWPIGGNFALSVMANTQTVSANQQWVNDSSGNGDRQSLGTSVSGRYSYVAPALTWGSRQRDGSGLEIGLGIGMWSGNFSGDAIFAPNNQATALMPHTPVNVRFNQLGYDTRLSLYYRHWALIMTVGGPFKFHDQNIKYEFQQVAMILGYEFRL